MRLCLRRREFIAALGGSAVWPLAARAQSRAVPTIGFLHEGAAESYSGPIRGFHQGLNETGFFEGGNLTIEYRWAIFDRVAVRSRLRGSRHAQGAAGAAQVFHDHWLTKGASHVVPDDPSGDIFVAAGLRTVHTARAAGTSLSWADFQRSSEDR
jgi:hypothetical protein